MLELKPTYRLAVILFGVAIALALFTRLYLSAADKRMRPAAATLTEPTKTGAKTLPTDLPDRTKPAAEQTSRELDGLLASAFEEMASPDQKDRNAIMAKVAMALDSRQAEAAIGAIMKELESGRDTKSGEDFVCGEEGLASASTWRVFLLDRLGRLDPRGAAEYARRVIFPSSNSAEEWAISLRHVLHSYPPMASGQGRTEISNLLARMLDRAEWRAESAAGLLEALDFIPHTPDPSNHLAALGVWLEGQGNAATTSAAQIAIERTMASQGDSVLAMFAEAAPLQGVPLRATAMARADLRRPAQDQAVANFLSQLPSGSPEAEVFFRAFPLHRYSVAPGLASVPRVPDASELRAADEAALVVVVRWTEDPALRVHRTALRELTTKLQELTGKK